MKRIIVILITLLCVSGVGAQSLYEVRGNVSSSEGALVGVVVVMPELGLWAVTDMEGEYVMVSVPEGEWKVEYRLVGYRTVEQKMSVPMLSAVKVKMAAESYELDDVTVTARQGTGAGTSSIIDRTAFEHQQTVSVADALQLLPGGVTNNPSLNESSVLTLRETNASDATTAMGTSLIIDNAQVNNDANMQIFSSATSTGSEVPSSASTGVDVRTVSTDRIESVEVIRGVASAEYGNMTSGAVVVKTRAAVSPFNIALKVDPKMKSVSVGRGVALGKRGAVLSADVDYAKSYKDERSKMTGYSRLTAQVSYRDTYKAGDTKLVVGGKVSGYISGNEEESDPDMLVREYVKEEKKNLSLNVNANWLLNKPWLTSLRAVVVGSVGHQLSEVLDAHVAELPTPFTGYMLDGEHEGAYYPATYDEIMRVDGKPINLQLKVTANKSHALKGVTGHLIVGAEYNLKGNNGDGKSGEYLPTGVRSRSFKDIPFISDVAIYAEEKLRLPIGSTRMELQAGVRLTNVMAEGYDYDMIVDPRLNMRYVIQEKGKNVLALRGGWGIQHKLPTLLHLYPDPAYLDMLSYSYVDNATHEGMALFTTKVVGATQNKSIDMPKSVNMELGLEIKQGKHIKVDAAFFYEDLTRGYTFVSDVESMGYRVYEATVEKGEYRGGELTVGGEMVPYKRDTTFLTYQRPVNAMEREKYGVEFSLDFGKIEALNTQVILDGMYIDIERRSNHKETYYSSGMINGENRKLAATCVSKSTYNVTHSKRLNTNLRLITRIPSVGLIFSLKGQCVWIDRSQRGVELDGRNMVEEIDGMKVVMPLSFVDGNGRVMTMTYAEAVGNVQTKDYIQRLKENALLEDNPKPYAMVDVRMTKEVGKWLQFSFYANNFTNSSPKRYLKSSDTYVYKNSDIYFGCDVRIKL